jgi:hypothetical protein
MPSNATLRASEILKTSRAQAAMASAVAGIVRF